MEFNEVLTEAAKQSDSAKLKALNKKFDDFADKLGDFDEEFMDLVLTLSLKDKKKSQIQKQSVKVTSDFIALQGKIKDFNNALKKHGLKELNFK